jgi:type III secretion protein V
VRGNYVVGAVVFLVLTTIQFVVIAKGSERVAEVAARFALDAMPGKQMAIDAELRGGSIDGIEAKRRRRSLQRESQFYGAMDGAMKFVKGDVVASVIIVLVNIVGGLAIGVAMKGLPIVDAMRRYGLLTIGDGLVTQLPALVLSTAAGVLVTRVASEEADTPLGDELVRQLLGVPKALQVAGGFVVLLAVVPGLPASPFLVLGAALLAIGSARSRATTAAQRRAATEAAPTDRARARGNEPTFIPLIVPWSIEVAPDLIPLLEKDTEGLREMATRVREQVFADLGVPLPAPRLRATAGIPEGGVRLTLHEVPSDVFDLPADGSDDDRISWLRDRITARLRVRAADFLGLAEVQRMLDELEQFAPATVRNVVPKPVTVVLLSDVLRRLVEEGISVRDLRGVLEGLSTVAVNEKDALNLTEYVRAHMRRAITYRLTAGLGQLDIILLDPLIEDTVRRAITRTPAGAFLALPPQAARDILASVQRALTGTGQASASLVILTQPDIRRFVRKLLEPDLPNIAVVSFAELLPEVALKPVARATPS